MLNNVVVMPVIKIFKFKNIFKRGEAFLQISLVVDILGGFHDDI